MFFDSFVLPGDKKEYSSVKEKKTRNKPEKKITWRNFSVTRRGMQGREKVIQNPGGVHSGPAKAEDTPVLISLHTRDDQNVH